MLRSVMLAVWVAAVLAGFMGAQAAIVEGEPRVEIWTDRGAGAVYHVGEDVEVCFRADRDCYVIVYEIDTDGYLRLLFPYNCGSDGFVEAGRVYRLGRGHFGMYYVAGPSGVEYVHALASIRPFRTLYWHGCAGYEDYAYDVSWQGFSDYWGCALPPRVSGDPYMAMQSIDEFICYDALDAGMAFADFTYFYVDQRVGYPRYVCYDCHGFGMGYRPYVHVCSGFSITFVNCDPCWDPWSWWWWCTPRRAYCGPRYVCHAKRPCRDWPSEYKWKSRSESYSSRTEYSRYWDERIRDKTPRVAETAGEAYKVKERDLYGREPRRDDGHKDVAVRDGRVEIIRPVEVHPYEGNRPRAVAPTDMGDRDRNEPRSTPLPVKVRTEKQEAGEHRPPAKPGSAEPKRVAPKPEREAKKVEVKRSSGSSREPARAPRVEIKRSGTSRSTGGNKKVAPKVRTGSSRGESPSRRRSLSE
jgi:hypothetical protein